MTASGAALSHEHDALDAVPARGRWVVKCRCGVGSVGMTLEHATRAYRAHAEIETMRAATARY